MYNTNTIKTTGMNSSHIFTLLKLKEHTLYKIDVTISISNVEHKAFLFTGFDSGSYCMIYTNNYEMPIKLTEAYSIHIIEELTDIK